MKISAWFILLWTAALTGTTGSGGTVPDRTAGAGNYYVNQRAGNASDENPGTFEAPFMTIAGAFRAVGADLSPGDHVWILDGLYREAVSLWPADVRIPHPEGVRVGAERVTLAGYPGHAPVISGSLPLEDWTPFRDPIWVTDFEWRRNSTFPVVFVDGQPLRQIGGTVETSPERWAGRHGDSLDDLEEGSFYYDGDEGKLYVWLAGGAQPEDHELFTYAQERRGVRIGAGLRHFTLRDVLIRHTGLSVWGEHSVVDNVDQAWGAFQGCYLRGHHSRILNSRFNHNGNSGMGSGVVTGIHILDCQTNHNNWRGWQSGWHAGGVKFISHSSHWLMERHEAAYNNGDGIWFDAGMSNVTIDGCRTYRNRGAGIHYEIGTRGVIRNNIAYENGARGIYLSNASHTTVINNLVYRNGMSGIVSIGIVRGDSSGGHNVIWGNILMDNCHPDLVKEEADGRGESWTTRPELIMPEESSRNVGNVSDFNIFFRGDGRSVPFWRGWHIDEYGDLDAWRDATGWDRNSVVAEPLFTDLANRDFRPAPGSTALWMLTQNDPAGIFDIAGVRRDSRIRTAGPYEGDLDELARIRQDLPLGPYMLLPWNVTFEGVPDPEKVFASRVMSGILPREDLGYAVSGWRVNDIPFIPYAGRPSVSVHLDAGGPGAVLRVEQQVRRLHILFNAEGMAPGRPFGEARVYRDDGHMIALAWTAEGEDVMSATPSEGTRTAHALTGRRRPDSPAYSFHVTTWENDNEWLPVSRIEFRLLDADAVWRIMGVTGERLGE